MENNISSPSHTKELSSSKSSGKDQSMPTTNDHEEVKSDMNESKKNKKNKRKGRYLRNNWCLIG